jgi:hypothetical protein
MRRIGLVVVVAISLLVATVAAQTNEVEILSKADAIRLFSTPKAE